MIAFMTDDRPARGTTGAEPDEPTFFGHPRGLMTLFTTEMWERFSYYGMRAILLYYLTDTAANGGLGLDDATGLAFVSIYGTSVYLLTIVGGWLADRVIGARRAVLYGGVIIAAGHVLLTIPGVGFSMSGIAFVALGTGLLKPNVSSMVGDLYARDDDRRNAAFTIFYMGINIGSLTAPFLVGWVREWGGYHAGFSVAAIGMAIALVFYVAGGRLLRDAGKDVPNPITRDEAPALVRGGLLLLLAVAVAMLLGTWAGGGWSIDAFIDGMSYLAFAAPIFYLTLMYRSPKVEDYERPRVLAYVPLFVAATFFWMIFEQAATTLSEFAKDSTDLTFLGTEVNPEFFQSVNPASIIILAPLFAWFWKKTKDQPPTAYKFVIGLTFAGLSFLWLAGVIVVMDGADAPAWTLAMVYVIQTLGELCLSPVGLAATTLLAPKAFRNQAMALWFLAPAAGQAITAQLVQATEGASQVAYFGWTGLVAVGVAVVLLFLSPWITRHIRHADALEAKRSDGGDEAPSAL
ncbi:proton-dependent oligopeptide transporter, POT family [Paraoerskovia marina]|uniref:Proton-dependent oligopeptide transporter, POT family n=2 Tax=Paraoerskovia marina TaxID=545619 RepID=A0A1H1RCG2_9CELL|nr:proton-dependent oligopeptide transporter, POT family [Paraoerskovia marina]